MHISINGPSTSECQPLIQEVTKQWLAKPLRNLARISTRPDGDQQPTQMPTTADASVQVDTQREDIMREWETAVNQVKNVDDIIAKEVEEAVAYLKLPPVDQDETMSESESESSDLEGSD